MKARPYNTRYDAAYFQGTDKSNYGDYLTTALGPSRMLANTLFELFRPRTSLDMGCAVGYSVKRLRELGVEAYGYDISKWAVEQAEAPYIGTFDFSTTPLDSTYELIYSYDVIEHIPEERLEFAARNLWTACEKNLVVVPALYPEGTTFDPNEETHEIFHPYEWWLDFFTARCGYVFDDHMTARLAEAEHSRIFNYSSRIFVFSKPQSPTATE
jgi:SAM-dependent methyltransferase